MFFQIAPVTNKELQFFCFFFLEGRGGGVGGEIYFSAHHSRCATTTNFSETLKFTFTETLNSLTTKTRKVQMHRRGVRHYR